MNTIAKTNEISAFGKHLENALQSRLRKVVTTIGKTQGTWADDIKVRTSPRGEMAEWRARLRVTFMVD